MFEHRPFGQKLQLAIRGASHAPCIQFTLTGFPRGFKVDEAELQQFMLRRAPGHDNLSTTRKEKDEVKFASGLKDGKTTGEPLVGRIANTDIRPQDYGNERTIPRPGHADFPQWVEMGRFPTGGGSNSGRLTAALCGAGGVCKQYLAKRGIQVTARLESIGGKKSGLEDEILAAKASLDSVGGTIVCEVTGLPVDVGGALFAGVETELAGALFAIPAVKGIEFGNGFAASTLRGSVNDDPFTIVDGEVKTTTNNHGGILGGRTSGMPLTFRLALKPTPTVYLELSSVDLKTMTSAPLAMKGRHDPCVSRRAVPVVEAVTAFVMTDLLLTKEALVPKICLTLTGHTLDEDYAQYQSQRYFCDLVELRVDLLKEAEKEKVAEFPKRMKAPVILTYRRQSDGGAYSGDEATRVAFFWKVLTPGCGFAYVDFEEDFRNDDLAERAEQAGVQIVRSKHDFTGPVTDIAAACRQLRGETEEIPKIAFKPNTAADVTRLFEETADFTDIPHVVCAMGALGLPSRILASRTHSLWTYASVAGLGVIGHVSPYELVRTYRFRTILPETEIRYADSAEVERANADASATDEDVVTLPIIKE